MKSKPSPALRHRAHSPAMLCLALTCTLLTWVPVSAQEAPAGAPAPTLAASVQTASLETSQVFPDREAAARVRARNVSRLAAEVGGTLQQWTVDVGAEVRRGQVLARIDPRDPELAVQRARAALQASQARLRLAQAQLDRARELTAQGFFSTEALAQRETEVALLLAETEANRAQMATTQRQLDKTVLRAPFDGEVIERLAQTGESVAPGSLLYVLAERTAVELDATLTPQDASALPQARRLHFEAEGLSHPVRLLRIGSTLSEPARTRTARLAFANAEATPVAGTAGTLRWQEGRPHLPPSLLVRRNGQLGVFVIAAQGNTTVARFQPLPGAQEGRAPLVPAGWNPSLQLVVRGQAALQDGQAVETRPAGR
ncbi:MAG TPA: efflux RND transporter periplasmic adaptor subunit [Hydrogenophaga sp.]|uniref:efflux RND transporter periplasmic adaptor subunit n=1 Tax=Hydrogenophaga sp. TaxID=1904254 RepID=UPI002CFA1753|nr:efflux RND transporter periplasmic adaptor subunit [Hydrogenophaga sp.]HMN92975.1 efflux RND transporter periplasmic adaptor subunit [Hydrogenophaga sp.]HMP09139.1 efflux RND transporter periplasmic adaptor subunit [Hydrogenophaga sp.]